MTRCGGRKLQAEKKRHAMGRGTRLPNMKAISFVNSSREKGMCGKKACVGKRHVWFKGEEYFQDGRRPRLYGGPYSFFDGVDKEHRL